MNDSQLTVVRLHARHKGEPLTPDLFEYFCEFVLKDEAAIRTAYAEGLADRASGARCLCPTCQLDVGRISGNEALRGAYSLRRREELHALGMDAAAISRKIDEEIAAGEALRGSTHG